MLEHMFFIQKGINFCVQAVFTHHTSLHFVLKFIFFNHNVLNDLVKKQIILIMTEANRHSLCSPIFFGGGYEN